MKLGINGFGRIGKLTAWHHLGEKFFDGLVVNLGRKVGNSIEDIAHYIERDSTYGLLRGFLKGYRSENVIADIDEQEGSMRVDGVKVKFLRSERDPARIGWAKENVRLVVDATGKYLDPTLSPDAPGGSVRGHLESGAEKVIVSAPFKIRQKGAGMPEDAVTTVMGVNENSYDPRTHRIISNASCTTTCLAHMIKPLLNAFGYKRILSASMATVHAVTGSQQALDRLPGAGKNDLRKNRSILNNIILTTTGAADALRLVIPEMSRIGFMAESVRVPVATGSLIILVIVAQNDPSRETITKHVINDIYREAAAGDPKNYLDFSEKQNVSRDITGIARAAAVIEGHETHTRTFEVNIDLKHVPGMEDASPADDAHVRVPVTQAVIYGWYDNEMAGYVHMLADRTMSIAGDMTD
ncbi:Glyceraldehyde-3-phosphate dehydrogenase [Candidatus Desulfarcum epimagneticum]|uniref:Glyceraldehyde-3-phosphate dehydrogenase n=1 Tax=uncultured Desulfobacteraceae bacterium TaxID=218296 RepID=A0A484HPD6_9BACT|nr:Glyceraldehyde-3-phosphate dehydrogenase [uncultured Desulfobacteraceae bacterium]